MINPYWFPCAPFCLLCVPKVVYLSPLSLHGCLFVPFVPLWLSICPLEKPLQTLDCLFVPFVPHGCLFVPCIPHGCLFVPYVPYGCLFVPYVCLSHSCLFVPFLPLCLSICPLCLSVTLMSICPLWHPMVVYLSPGKTVTNPGHTQCDTLKKCYKHLILD